MCTAPVFAGSSGGAPAGAAAAGAAAGAALGSAATIVRCASKTEMRLAVTDSDTRMQIFEMQISAS